MRNFSPHASAGSRQKNVGCTWHDDLQCSDLYLDLTMPEAFSAKNKFENLECPVDFE
jgi:hypothetical protein